MNEIRISGNCRNTINEEQNEITSPNFPSKYPNDVHCGWKIVVQQGYLIELNIIKLNIESENDECIYDWLEYQNFDTADNKTEPRSRKKLCGDNPPTNIISTGNKVILKFKTDEGETRTGFKIRYSRISVGKEVHPTDFSCEGINGCIYHIFNTIKLIVSPNYSKTSK